MKISGFNNEYLVPLLAKILQEEKACLLIVNFNINLLNKNADFKVSDFYNILSLNFFAPYILHPTRLTKNSKTLIDNIFLDTIEFSTFLAILQLFANTGPSSTILNSKMQYPIQNPIQKFRQNSIVFVKPGILPENLKTLTSSNYPTVQYVLLKLCTRFLFNIFYKRV